MSAPYKPMLAKPMSAKGIVTRWSDWAIEEKYDGHRLIIEVAAARHGVEVTAWSRPRGDDQEMAVRELPTHLVADLEKLPAGVYDGELLVAVKDATGTDVTRTDLEHFRYVVLFDVLRYAPQGDTVGWPYVDRHELLQVIDRSTSKLSVMVAPMVLVNSEADVKRFVERVWKRGGEGAILKRRLGTYEPGIRSKNCVKVKRVSHATLTVVGFEPSRGTVRFPGHPFAVVKLRDVEGNETTVKTKDDFELNRLMSQWSVSTKSGLPYKAGDPHPALGRQLVIEFPKRTRTGGYQGPVLWDRWADQDGE